MELEILRDLSSHILNLHNEVINWLCYENAPFWNIRLNYLNLVFLFFFVYKKNVVYTRVQITRITHDDTLHEQDRIRVLLEGWNLFSGVIRSALKKDENRKL